MRCEGFDTVKLGSSRKKTKEGYLLARGVIAVADNVQPYLARELKLQGVPPDKIIRIYRPKEEVAKSAKAYDGVPITLEHPSKMVNATLYKTVNRGDVRDTQVDPETGDLTSELFVKDSAAIEAIESGAKKELSAAYDFELTMKSGVSPRGEAYDGIATDFAPNHVAITGRARGRTADGRVCHVADSQGEKIMRRLVFDAAVLGTLTGLSIELDDSVATQVEDSMRGILAQRDEAIQARDSLLTEVSTRVEALQAEHKAAMDALTAEIPALVEAQVADRTALLAGAAGIGITVKTEGKDTDTLRREILTEAGKDATRKKVMDAMIPDLAKADGAALTLATNALFALGNAAPAKKKATGHDSLGAALAGKKDPAVANDSAPKPTGRAAMVSSSSTAWKRGK